MQLKTINCEDLPSVKIETDPSSKTIPYSILTIRLFRTTWLLSVPAGILCMECEFNQHDLQSLQSLQLYLAVSLLIYVRLRLIRRSSDTCWNVGAGDAFKFRGQLGQLM